MTTFKGINLVALALLSLYPISLIIFSVVYGNINWTFAVFPTTFILALTLTQRRWVSILARIYYTFCLITGINHVILAKYSFKSTIAYFEEILEKLQLQDLGAMMIDILKNLFPASFYENDELTTTGLVIVSVLFILLPLISVVVVYSKKGIFALREGTGKGDLEAPVKSTGYRAH